MTPEQKAARGDIAQRYIEDPLVQEAFTEIQSALHSAWEDSPAKDRDGREAAYFMLKCFKEFRSFFELVVTDGDFSKEEMERKLKKSIKQTRR